MDRLPFILYACIYRREELLAYHETCSGDFAVVLPQIIRALPYDGPAGSFNVDELRFLYVRDRDFIFGCITKPQHSNAVGFALLEQLASKFLDRFFHPSQSCLAFELQRAMQPMIAGSVEHFNALEEEDIHDVVDALPDLLKKMKPRSLKSLFPYGTAAPMLAQPSPFRRRAIYEERASVDVKRIRRSWASRHQTLIIVSIGVLLLLTLIYVFLIAVLLGTWPYILTKSDYRLQ
jgi:hypothetical protein